MMKQPSLGHISPCFIVSDVPRAIEFYEERLGFETRFSAPEEQPFFAVVGRDSVQLYLKDVSDDSVTISPQPNHTRHRWAPWDAFVFLEDPDALAEELASRRVDFHKQIHDTDDGLRGFEVRDRDGYVLFFGRPK
jgi:catechol 2,3-dioxygenase-like lactoylglutathione lyase family enzyme